MKKLSVIAAVVSLVILYAVPGYGDHELDHDDGNIQMDNFYVTMSKMEISKDGGSTWFTIFQGNTEEVDLITLTVSSLLKQKKVPAGTYNKYRVTVSNSRINFSVAAHSGHAAGTLTNLGQAGSQGAPSYPIVDEGSMNLTINRNGTTNAVIDMDKDASWKGSINCNEGTTAATVVYTPGTGFDIDPVITVQ